MALNYHQNLSEQVSNATHVFVLLSDRRTEAFLSDIPHALRTGRIWIHASGSLETPLAHRAHPLFSFHGFEALPIETYQMIPFVISADGPELPTSFRGSRINITG